MLRNPFSRGHLVLAACVGAAGAWYVWSEYRSIPQTAEVVNGPCHEFYLAFRPDIRAMLWKVTPDQSGLLVMNDSIPNAYFGRRLSFDPSPDSVRIDLAEWSAARGSEREILSARYGDHAGVRAPRFGEEDFVPFTKRQRFPPKGQRWADPKVISSPDGKRIAVMSYDGARHGDYGRFGEFFSWGHLYPVGARFFVQLFDVEDGKEIAAVSGNTGRQQDAGELFAGAGWVDDRIFVLTFADRKSVVGCKFGELGR